ncbi:MAG: roadblock/LC7 domain-containing protein [Candidatus Thorarchaeota archaeon]
MSSVTDALTMVLEDLNSTGRVKASIVADEEGFVIASAVRRGVDEKVTAVMGSIVHNAAERAREELALGAMRDITMRCEDGILVCKSTQMQDGRHIILAALVPRNTRFFLRAVNNALREIREALRVLDL